MSSIDPEIRDFYADRYDEDDRLRGRAHGVLELVRTRELVERVLPPAPASVLDVGGATGIHAEWLSARGYRVHVVDPVESHVARGARLPGVTAEIGDARELSAGEATQDVVLLLGPLYHLVDRADRLTALREAVRVARPGAPILAAGINRFATLMDIGSDGRLTAETEPFLRHLHETGVYRAEVLGFTTAYFHTPDGLLAEVQAAGLQDADVFGIEGPAGPTLRALGPDCLDERLDAAVRAARMVERHPQLRAASSHLLAVGRRTLRSPPTRRG